MAAAALANLVSHLVSLLCPEIYFSLRLRPTPGPTAGPDEVEDVLLPQGEALLVHQLGPVAAVVGADDSDRLLDIERQEAGSGARRVRNTADEILATLGSRGGRAVAPELCMWMILLAPRDTMTRIQGNYRHGWLIKATRGEYISILSI